jgi:hypothetical protein
MEMLTVILTKMRANGELDPAHHPLLRAGAVPRMSKGARDMVVGIVEEAFMGSGGQEEDELDEEDELED